MAVTNFCDEEARNYYQMTMMLWGKGQNQSLRITFTQQPHYCPQVCFILGCSHEHFPLCPTHRNTHVHTHTHTHTHKRSQELSVPQWFLICCPLIMSCKLSHLLSFIKVDLEGGSLQSFKTSPQNIYKLDYCVLHYDMNLNQAICEDSR